MDQAVKSILDSFDLVRPEVALLAMACLQFLLAPFVVSSNSQVATVRNRFAGLSLVAVLVAAWFWLASAPVDASSSVRFQGPFRLDELAWFMRGLSLVIGVVLLLVSWNQFAADDVGECHACLLLILAGVNFVAAANDLVGLFLALELVSIPTYVLLYLLRRNVAGQEAVLKYFLLSIFSSALVLYGFSYLYGAAGTTNLEEIRASLSQPETTSTVILAVALAAVIAGTGFRITAVPFHFYAPDVFQGTHAAGAAMLSILPKLAGFTVLLRLIAILPIAAAILPEGAALPNAVSPVLWWLAVITMCVGNVLALWQTNVPRLLAYSSIAHGGYMLVGLALGHASGSLAGGTESLLFYLAVYGLMTVGAFSVLIYLSRPERPVEMIDDLAGLGRSQPGAALLLAVFLFSLTGLPPTAGFFGKLNLLLAAWSGGTFAARSLAVVMALNAAIGAAYYLRIIGAMYLRPATAPIAKPAELPALVGSLLCAAGTLAIFFAPQWLWHVVAGISV